MKELRRTVEEPKKVAREAGQIQRHRMALMGKDLESLPSELP